MHGGGGRFIGWFSAASALGSYELRRAADACDRAAAWVAAAFLASRAYAARLGSAGVGDFDGDVGGFDGGDCEHSRF
jgi:hypothetical protein